MTRFPSSPQKMHEPFSKPLPSSWGMELLCLVSGFSMGAPSSLRDVGRFTAVKILVTWLWMVNWGSMICLQVNERGYIFVSISLQIKSRLGCFLHCCRRFVIELSRAAHFYTGVAYDARSVALIVWGVPTSVTIISLPETIFLNMFSLWYPPEYFLCLHNSNILITW